MAPELVLKTSTLNKIVREGKKIGEEASRRDNQPQIASTLCVEAACPLTVGCHACSYPAH